MDKKDIKKLDDFLLNLKQSGNKPKLLLHACCGPCASYALEFLTPYFSLDVYFYNPSIMPPDEFYLRYENLKKLVDNFKGVGLILDDGGREEYLEKVKGLEFEPERGPRCAVCILDRLEKTAKRAKGYDYFTTTLSVSPHKDADMINRLGAAAEALSNGAKFLPADFKKKGGYKRSIELSEKYNLYRQSYCGCRFI